MSDRVTIPLVFLPSVTTDTNVRAQTVAPPHGSTHQYPSLAVQREPLTAKQKGEMITPHGVNSIASFLTSFRHKPVRVT